jgi:hypothetical protein
MKINNVFWICIQIYGSYNPIIHSPVELFYVSRQEGEVFIHDRNSRSYRGMELINCWASVATGGHVRSEDEIQYYQHYHESGIDKMGN